MSSEGIIISGRLLQAGISPLFHIRICNYFFDFDFILK